MSTEDAALAEQMRFNAEVTRLLLHERTCVPWQAVALMGVGGALVAATVALMTALGR